MRPRLTSTVSIALLVSLALSCVTQGNRRFLAAYPIDGAGTWLAFPEEPGTPLLDGEGRPLAAAAPAPGASSFTLPPDGRVLLPSSSPHRSGLLLREPRDASQPPPLVIYHVLVGFFANGDPANDRVAARPDPGYPGGDLRGLLARLDHVASLGVNAVWLSPVFEADSEHGYGASNYYEVSGALGVPGDRAASRELFREVVRRCHARGLRVILDVALNHASPWYDLAGGDPHGLRPRTTGPLQFEERRYFASGGFRYWDFDDPGTRAFLLEAALHWIRDEGVDGLRLDYARGVPLSFWAELHRRVKAVRPDAFLVAEVWPLPWEGVDPLAVHWAGDPHAGAAFDSVLDFPTCWAVTSVFQRTNLIQTPFASFSVGGDRSPVRLERLLQEQAARYPPDARPTFFLDNHDMSRFASYGRDRRRTLAAFAFLATLSGHLALYYGTETALASPASEQRRPTGRQPMPWDALDPATVRAFREIIAVRRAHPSLETGFRVPLHADGAVLVMAKVGASERALVGVNLSDEERVVELEAGTLLRGGGAGTTVLGTSRPNVEAGRIRWALPPVSTSIYVER